MSAESHDPESFSPTDWESWRPNMLANLVFIVVGSRVLLIHKKTGLGRGKINGPGGKLEPGESAADAAVREVQEELRITPGTLSERGVLHFAFTDGLHLEVTVFRAAGFEGTPTETREAKPEWFEVDAIPYDRMWPDDEFWLPQMLAGQRFRAWFDFEEEQMLSKRIEFFD